MFDLPRIHRQTFVRYVDYHESIGSTNDRARQLAARQPLAMPLLVLAERQTAGRGRGSNRWWSTDGSLTFSLLLGSEHLPADPRRSPLASLAAALAVIDALAERSPPLEAGLHWPNDVVLAGRKVAGILVEVLADRRHVLGIGLNTNNRFDQAPVDVRRRAGSLLELTGHAHNQDSVLIDLLRALAARLDQLRADAEKLAAEADRHCLQRGTDLAIEQGTQRVTGRCAGIASDGSLLLETAEGRRAFASGVLLKR